MFSETEFTVVGEFGESLADGLTSDLFPGLAVHFFDDPDKWAVTHLATGRRFREALVPLYDALNFAVSVAKMVDWRKLQTVEQVEAFGKEHRREIAALGLDSSRLSTKSNS